MAQRTSGVLAVLSHPLAYEAVQLLMGAQGERERFVRRFVRPFPGMKVLDIGCGPADILAHLPECAYWGFDISTRYIEQAKRRFGERGHFSARLLAPSDMDRLPSMDVVLALGVLHHLDDATAIEVLRLAASALKPGGRLLTIDPCLVPGQNPIARFLIRSDRGQNVRDLAGYRVLAASVFESPTALVQHQAWIPYTRCFMECTKTRGKT